MHGRLGAVFFDRDGVLNHDLCYVHRRDHFRWVEGAREAVLRVNRAALCAIVVTNQSGVARGYHSLDDVALLHGHMKDELAEIGARIDPFYLCPYHDQGVCGEFVCADHFDRKPNPGMLLHAIADFGIDPDRSWMIGDRETDIEAGSRAGVSTALFSGGSLDDFVGRLLATEMTR